MKAPLLMSAHQPVYLPWLGLMHKIAVADLFVIYDDVPYSRKMWYNRNKVRGANGIVTLSVPVRLKGSSEVKQCDVRIDNTTRWAKKHWRTIELSYGKTPYFDRYADGLSRIYAANWERLAALNEALLKTLLGYLEIDTPIERASSVSLDGQKSSRVLDMCRKFGADIYLFGTLGRGYADVSEFVRAGIVPLFQEYRHPTYDQGPRSSFEPYLSVVDLLFSHGPDSREILLAGNATREEYVREAESVRARFEGRELGASRA